MAILTPATGSIIENANGGNRTGTALSCNIIIRVGPNPVGAIQSINITETRQVERVNEVGTDGNIDSAPIKSAEVSGNCKRIRYDRHRISEAFSRGFLHVKSQRIPFDIDIFDKWSGDNEGMIVTTLKNVWITNLSYSYEANNFIIADDMQWIAEDISSTIQGSKNAATGGSRGIVMQTDSAGIERETDRGMRRGSLDAANLLGSVFAGF